MSGTAGTQDAVRELLRRCTPNGRLATLDLSITAMDRVACATLGDLLAWSMTLTELHLGGNRDIRDEGTKEITRGLKAMKANGSSLNRMVMHLT